MVTIYSDGSSRGNPGPGGFGTIVVYTDSKGINHELEISKGYENTTNNRMELMGVIYGLEALVRPCEVNVVSDSKYVIDAFNQHWIDGWQKSNWKRGTVKNIDLWKRLLEAMSIHSVRFTWIKGHAGHPYNERCDSMAVDSALSEDLLVDIGYID